MSNPNCHGTRESFEKRMDEKGLAPLWSVMSGLVKPEPGPTCAPCFWAYETVRPLLEEAAATVPAELAERRVLVLENPGLRGSSGVTQSLYAGLQIVRPGEVAPPHRHSQAALRFCLESEGAYTMVDDRKIEMSPFDLVLTPSFSWHEHGNIGASDAVWLDGLDIPIVRFFAVEFAEHGPSVTANAKPDPRSRVLARAHRPLDADSAPLAFHRGGGVVHYPYSEWRRSLSELLDGAEGNTVAMEFSDPTTGGPVLRTIAAFARIVKSQATVAPRKSTESQVFVVVEGAGTLTIDDQAVELAPRTVAVSPPWAQIKIETTEQTVLFSFSDRAAQRALGLWRLAGDVP